MSLSRKIAAALDENTKAYTPPCEVTVEEGAHRLTLNLSAVDTVGVGLDSLEFATTSRPEWTVPELRAWGERLAARVTYLMEPLKILEIDATDGEVHLRSQSPTARDDRRGYYEVRLYRQGSLRMERCSFDEVARRRSKVPCQFTREVLERLADDIAASLS